MSSSGHNAQLRVKQTLKSGGCSPTMQFCKTFVQKKKEMRRKLWVTMKRSRYLSLYKATLAANKLVAKGEITDEGWNELIELELDERMTETDIKHLRRLCEAETLLLLEHFGHSNYDEVTVKQRLKMPKSLSYTDTSSVDQAEKPSRKSSFRKFPKAKKKKKTKNPQKKKVHHGVYGLHEECRRVWLKRRGI